MSTGANRLLPTIVCSILSGLLLGCAFPPVDIKWLAWVGLVPLLVALERAPSPRRAFLLGYVAGLVFFLLTLHPLVSAHAWTGWATVTQEQLTSRLSRQWWFMHGIWLAFSVWCALFWAVWAAGMARLSASGWRALVIAPSLWVLLPEWARAQTTFGFGWAFLGNATADLPAIRQLAAIGGAWLLSALVVLVNMGLAQVLHCKERAWWLRPAVVAGALALAWAAGTASLAHRRPEGTAIPVGVVQHSQPTYAPSDFLSVGLDRHYLPMVREALDQRLALILLPESIVLGALSLDGLPSPTKPLQALTSRQAWETSLRATLGASEAVLILGLDTVEQGKDYNTLTVWTREGLAGWYHKRRLVPFSEYRPRGWGGWAIRGASQYSPGQGSQLIRVNDLALGGFICQEVLFPWVTRQSARDGAMLLISGGNDGVFANPAVAQVHADAAQLRAVETGRYVVRAMKTGISAIIDPTGQELVRSRMNEAALLVNRLWPVEGRTPYVRFGDWVVWLSAVIALLTILPRRRAG